MKNVFAHIAVLGRANSLRRLLPWLLLIASVSVFMKFITSTQQQHNVLNNLKILKDSGEIITLDDWQAQPYHCPNQAVSLDDCKALSNTDFKVTLPTNTSFFARLKSENDKEALAINAARLKYRLKINEIDWIKQEKYDNTLLFSLVIPRTSQDLMFVYADPAGATQHGGRGVNVVASFGRTELLTHPEFTIDILAPSYSSKFGPQTLPIALMTPSRSTPYLNFIQQMQSSSLPATLISILLPVLAAAMAVILDGSKIMFHISGYALLRGIQALIAQSFNSMDGRGDTFLGQINGSVSKYTLILTICTSAGWLIYVIRELIQTPNARETSLKNKIQISLLPSLTLLAVALFVPQTTFNLSQLERSADVVVGAVVSCIAAYSMFKYFQLRKKNTLEPMTLDIEEQHTLFNPVHFYVLRSAFVTSATLLMSYASFRNLSSSFEGILHYDPLDWRQSILTPVLLLSAILGVGSVTQKMNQYAQLMRNRVEHLMTGSRKLASSHKNILAIVAALKILQEEIATLKLEGVEVIVPDIKNRMIFEYKITFPHTLDDLETVPPSEREGAHPVNDHNTVTVAGNFLTLQLFQDNRWLGTVSWESDSLLFLTHEEMHFINVTLQTLCLTLDNLNAIDELRRVDKLKDDFLANTSHELRTPLHGIIGIAESLLNFKEIGLSARMRDNLTLISVSARRLTSLVNDLLDFSQIKQRELKLRPTRVDLHPLIQLIFALNRPLLDRKNIELINEVQQELAQVYCDESRLHQILQNLIGNAIKFTNSGSVRVTASQQNRFISLCVIDTGIGIEPEKIPKIFNSFEQADGSINRIYGGTGLGLTITKHLVELQGGKVSVESTPDVGSTFTISLPLMKAGTSETLYQTTLGTTGVPERPKLIDDEKQWWENQKVTNRAGPTLIPSSGRKPQFKILVVDDDAINRRILENQLMGENYQILIADDGLAAIELMKQNTLDLILLDLMMPKMSGLDVLAHIRTVHSAGELPVIILTAKNQSSDLVACFAAGANDFLMKPFSQAELLARIKNHLEISQVHGAYSRFIPTDFLDLLGRESIVDVRLGDQILKEMSVMFLDIREFSKISEKMTPEENFNFLNQYYATVNPIIVRNFGFIDKYIGDAVMALFTNRTDDALISACELIRQLEEYNNRRKTEFQKPINIGIGIHFGPLMLGTLGNEQRMEGTVISESVNLASRLESITKVFSVNIIASQDTVLLAANPSQFLFRSLGRVRPPGFSKSLNIVEVFNSDTRHLRDLKLKTLTQHESTLKSFQLRNWDAAIDGWKSILDENPADKVAALYLDRSVRNKQHPPGDDWDGTFELRSR